MGELRVSEIFDTVQGEGPRTGHPATFLRLSGCNLDCRWCDTPYTWDWEGKNGQAYDRQAETTHWDIPELAADLAGRGMGLLVITGGEPLLQQRGLVELLGELRRGQHWYGDIEVETNGTRSPVAELKLACHFNVSPKLSHSGVDRKKAIKSVLGEFANGDVFACFKFVCATPADLDEVDAIVTAYEIHESKVWIMPEGRYAITLAETMRDLTPGVLEHGWKLTGRLQVTLWGDERGR